MALKCFLLLLLFGSVSCDRLKFHLENLVDRNISACDDFYHHVCSQQVDPKEFFIHRSTFMLNEAIDRLHPQVIKHSPIEYDLQHLRDKIIRKEDNNYEKLIRLRCENDIACYKNDHEFYAVKMKIMNKPINSIISSANETIVYTIDTYINETSRIIEELIDYINSPIGLDKNSPFNHSITFHNGIHTRIRLIEFLESNNTFTDFHDIKEIAETMKRKMIDKLNQNLFNATGIHRLDTLLRLNFAYNQLHKKNTKAMNLFIYRIAYNFQWNAFFDSDLKSVTMLAPFMHKSVFQSDALKEPFITYFTVGHELHHSLFSRDTPILLNIYGERLQCIFDHYNRNCSKFAMGACRSGKQTIIEDGPDLESWRTLISLFRDRYNDDELNKSVFGSETTLEQAFFYYVSSAFCANDELRTEEEAKTKKHSAFNIRVNGVLSLLPEFTNAFGCQKGDAMYVEEKDS
ncbi:hypothetical protein PRIPAC_95212 [Pristionchus pacificus]|uniref:Peptidase n=1 Tax=Pristionchus pacificus TaxID=54126 RepID=A0A2A6BJQ4_PRIPA|nr:hypothetical protein PRIPAC_95212 [Pristionchus pacificus]|eukprot:PDM66068.1 Peptidase [Pristionchus pacificus]